MDKIKIKQQVIDFTINGVNAFLQKNPDLEFYAFAYDCNAEYGTIYLCFNTLSDFKKTLEEYTNGQYSEYYKSEEQIKKLKYNTGDWEYQCFETMHVIPESEVRKIFDDFPDDNYKTANAFIEDLMELFCECLIEFRTTKSFASIPKSNDFVSFCIDHDDSMETADKRLQKILLLE